MLDLYQIRILNTLKIIKEEFKGVNRQFALKAGMQPGYVSRMLKPNASGKKRIGDDLARRIEQAGGKPENWLDRDHTYALLLPIGPHLANEPDIITLAGPAMRPVRTIHVAAHARGADHGSFIQEAATVNVTLLFPTADHGAYALQFLGDKMAPRIRHGEYVIVEPNTPPRAGDDVLIETTDNGSLCTRLLFTTDSVLTLGSINDSGPTMTLALDRVAHMRRVAGIIPNGVSG